MLRKLLFSLCIFFITFYKYIYYKNEKRCFKILEKNGSNCLICFTGQTRAADATWNAFKKHVLDVINPGGSTDIALSISKDESNINILYKNAKYIWDFDEKSDIGECFEFAANTYNVFDKKWRDILQIEGYWLGGIDDPVYKHETRSSIMLFYRWFLYYNLKNNNLLNNYDWFIITRSDNYYIKDHISIPYIRCKYGNKILIPNGEDYGGYCDRHIICHRSYIESVLDMLSPIMTQTSNLIKTMSKSDGYSGYGWNNESYQKLLLDSGNVSNKIIRIPRAMFLVRELDGPTSFSTGEYDSRYGLIVKYKSEMEQAEKDKFL